MRVYSHAKVKFIADPYRGSLDKERWEPIPDSNYWVSNHGRVLRRVILIRYKKPSPRKPFTRRCNMKPRKPRRIKHYSLHVIHPKEVSGGRLVGIWDGHRVCKRSYYMHLLVADTFQLREPGEKVLFRDGDIWNPRLSNLKVKGSPKGRLSNRQKRFCKELFAKYPSNIIIPELAARFSAAHVTVWKVYKEYENECATNGNPNVNQHRDSELLRGTEG